MSELLAVPNVSEGRDAGAIQAIGRAFDGHLLNVHSDPDHHRTVYTLAGHPGRLVDHVVSGIRQAVDEIDLNHHGGTHPRVGAVDVAPIVYLTEERRGAACAEALVLADRLGDELQLPVFLYGELAGGRTRAHLRKGGPQALAARIAQEELRPDFGPHQLHPTAGAVLVAARPPLVAFNLELAPTATEADAKRIASELREGGPAGLPGVRAIGLWLEHRGCAQLSTNVEDHRRTGLATLVQAVRERAVVTEAELVGLAPQAAFDGFPEDVPVRNRNTIEDALGLDAREAPE